MITKIICPTDFSDAAINATEYAAKLAQAINANLLLVNVERIMPVSSAVSLGEGIGNNTRENSLLATERLKESSEQINKAFKISVDYEVDVTTKSLAKTIASLDNKNAMIVMGTNGADNLTEFLFGTHTYNVIKTAKCPVLLVPENYSYKSYKSMLFAMSYEGKSFRALKPFYEFAKNFETDITFLHISDKDTDISRDVFNAEKEEVEAVFTGRQGLSFKRDFSEDIAFALERFLSTTPADLLVIAVRHRNIIESLFKQKALKTLSADPFYPILVLHA